MGELTNLPRVDPAPVEYIDELANEFLRWLANTVDQLNASWQQLDDIIHVGQSDNASATPSSTTKPIAVTDMTAQSVVIPRIVSSTNPVTIVSVAPGVGSFTVTLSGDPGASIILNYTAIVVTK